MNTSCTFYDPVTGEVTGHGAVSEDTLETYVNLSLPVLLDVTVDSNTHYLNVDTLEVISYTESELAAKGAIPKGWKWQMPQKVAVDLRELADTKVKTLSWINLERARLIYAFDRFTYNGYVFDGNAPARENIKDAADGARINQILPVGFTWTLFDNTDIPMTSAQILEMEAAFLEAWNLNKYTRHTTARYLKAQVETAETTGGLDAIKQIPWPAPE